MRPAKHVSEAVEWELATMLFTQTPTLIAGAVGLMLVGVVGWLQTHQLWFVPWTIATGALVILRVAIDLSFVRRRPHAKVGTWQRRYLVLASAMGILIGATALVIVFHVPPLVQVLAFSVKTAIVMGGAARNASCPRAAKAQIYLALAPTFVVCVTSGDGFYLMLGIAVIFEGLSALQLTRYLHSRTVEFLRANEENVILVDAVRRANSELAAANDRLAMMATTDALTGIANRRRFDEVLREESARVQRDSTDLSLLLLDIDSFKAFNDLYGHQAGDACLQRVARALAGAMRRPADFVARYGGEEFVAVLPQTNAAGATALAESVRLAIEALHIVHAAGPAGVVTASIGVATFADRFHRPEDFVRAADDALYAAKGAGRNCVRVGQREGALL